MFNKTTIAAFKFRPSGPVIRYGNAAQSNSHAYLTHLAWILEPLYIRTYVPVRTQSLVLYLLSVCRPFSVIQNGLYRHQSSAQSLTGGNRQHRTQFHFHLTTITSPCTNKRQHNAMGLYGAAPEDASEVQTRRGEATKTAL